MQSPRLFERLRTRLRPIEQVLLENWTGILGAALLVTGVGFLGIYAAVNVGPIIRSAMIGGVAVLLVGLAYWIRDRAQWQQLARLLRSSAAGIFLFVCFGAGAIPGLRFIENDVAALTAVIVGILANLYLAFAGRAQVFASLHVVLSLIPLAIIPASQSTFVLGVLVTLFGVGLCYHARWDVHLLSTLLTFSAFHADWVLGMGNALDSGVVRVIGASGAVAVASGAALVHYRKEYESRVFERIPFIVHLANWALLGLSLSFYVHKAEGRGWVLLTAAVAAYLMSRRGKALGVRWAHLTDTLVAQGLVMAGIASFYSWVENWLLIVAALFAQAALFTRVVANEDEPLLTRTGLYLLHGTGAVLLLGAMGDLGAGSDVRLQHALVLVGAAALGVVRHLFFLRDRGERFDSGDLYGWGGTISILGVGIGLLAAVALAMLHDFAWMSASALVVVGGLVGTARRSGSRGLAIGSLAALVVAHAIVWGKTLFDPFGPLTVDAAQLAPLVPLAALAIAYPIGGTLGASLRDLAIYVAGAHLGVAAFVLTQTTSPVIPGVLWLILSLVALEVANRVPAPSSQPCSTLATDTSEPSGPRTCWYTCRRRLTWVRFRRACLQRRWVWARSPIGGWRSRARRCGTRRAGCVYSRTSSNLPFCFSSPR
ncbi:MAG: hypothetical protein IH885_08600 [Myxococcales bacterium]|nr:hypothetical protein [Myxococcales bacterium]